MGQRLAKDGSGPRTEDIGAEQMRRRFVNGMLRWGHLHGGIKRSAIFAGYSEHTASSTGSKLMDIPEIRDAIIAAQNARTEKLEISPEKTLAAIAAIAYSDIGDVMTWEKNRVELRDLADLTPEESAIISSVSETKIRGGGTKLEVKTHDRLRALDMLAKHQGLCRDKSEGNKLAIGGVLRVPARATAEEWEQQEAIFPSDGSDPEAEP